MSEKRPWFVPLVASVLIHAVALGLLFFIRLKEAPPREHVTKNFRVRGVKDLPSIPGAPGGGKAASSRMKFLNAGKTAPVLAKDVSVKDLVTPSDISKDSQIDVSPKKVELQNPSLVSSRDFKTILTKTDERQLKEKVQSNRQSTATPLDKLLTQDKRPTAAHLVQSLGEPLAGLDFGPPANIGIDPDEGMPGFTPTGSGGGGGGGTGSGSPGGAPDGTLGEARGEVTRYQALDEFLDIQVFTYADPAGGEKYYMIKIFPRKGVKEFQVMPKEMIFTIDSSLSISPDRLDEFKKGIVYCLRNLNKEDVFNVVAFRDAPEFFSPQSIPATPEAIARAEKFVAGLTSNQKTDMFGAVEGIVRRPPVRRPSNVLLLTDGRPTHGVVDDRQLLSEISRINAKVRPIFAFSGGRRTNRYLLDFAAYQNRAWSQYVKRTTDIGEGLAAFYDKIRDPIFLNLRYRLNGVDETDVYPKALPDFYKNAEFTIFGRYKDEDQFSMQLLGDVQGDTRELVFGRSLKEAQPGTADIQKGYAFNRVYYLISRLNAEPDNKDLEREIRELSQRYGITTPYSPELANLD